MKATIRQHHALIWLAMLAACIPYALKITYVISAWRSSPLDAHDWLFLPVGFALIAVSCIGLKTKDESNFDWMAPLLLLPVFLLYIYGFIKHIHAVSIISAILFAALFILFLWGWSRFVLCLPAFVVFCLSATSTTYWLSNFLTPLHCDGFHAKIAIAIVATIVAVLQRHFHFIPRKHETLFACFAVAAFLFILLSLNANIKSVPFIPDFSHRSLPSAIGCEQEPTAADLQFFAGSIPQKYYFATNDGGGVNVLAVSLGDNVHQIHPPSHCLRSGGARIQSEQRHQTELNSDQALTVTEIITEGKNQQFVLWYWYSNREYSTPGFISFRKAWKSGVEWHSYQISTNAYNGDLETARNRLHTILAEIAYKNSPLQK
ncbi:MAG: exosortase-associated EpsI family protein [Victivallales bacterium]|nr:exosortase-associated EpsI family protein [Victivallales bacterium]